MLKKFSLFLFLLLVRNAVCAQETEKAAAPDDAFARTVSRMMEVTNVYGTMDALVPQMLDMLKQQVPGVPAEFWDEMRKEFTAGFGELIEMYVPVCREYFTQEDLVRVIEFYESPVGRKFAAASPPHCGACRSRGTAVGDENDGTGDGTASGEGVPVISGRAIGAGRPSGIPSVGEGKSFEKSRKRM